MQVFITLPQSQDHQVTDGSSAASSPLPRPSVSLPARMGPLNCLLDIEREYLESLSSRLRLRLYVGLARSGEGKAKADPGVSRRHALITVGGTADDPVVAIEDLGSTNGIIVNGSRVHQTQLLDGSRIELGNTRMLVHSPSEQ